MRSSTAKMVLRSALTMVGLLALYAVIPVPGQREPLWFTVLMALVGLAALAYAFITLAQRAQRAQRADTASKQTSIRLEALIAVLYAFVVFVSLVYLALSSSAGQFSGLHTRVDALYFTTSTISTVGFGDIHATGQASRALVTLQMFLDLVFVGLTARIILPTLARQRAEKQGEQLSGSDPEDDPQDPPASAWPPA